MTLAQIMTKRSMVVAQVTVNWIFAILLVLTSAATYLFSNSELSNIPFFAVCVMFMLVCLIFYRLILQKGSWPTILSFISILAMIAAIILLSYYGYYRPY